jgi:hypothetical protein
LYDSRISRIVRVCFCFLLGRAISSTLASSAEIPQGLETATLILDETLELGLALSHGLLAATDVAGAAPQFTLALIEEIELLVELGFAFIDASFLALHLITSVTGFDLPGLPRLDELFLAGEHGTLPQGFGLALGVANDPFGRFLSSGLGRLLLGDYGLATLRATYKEKRCGQDGGKRAKRSD